MQESEDLNDITSTVVNYRYRNNGEITVNITNLSTQTVSISPKVIICELQTVIGDEEVFDKLEHHSEDEEEILNQVHIESTRD